MGITNPTSIQGKSKTYHDIAQAHNLHLMTASETAAAMRGQQVFTQGINHVSVMFIGAHHPKTEQLAQMELLPSKAMLQE